MRTPEGAVWLFGAHALRAALANPRRRLHRLLLTAEAARSLEGRLPAGVAAENVERVKLDQLLPAGAVHQGMAGLFEALPEPDLEEACATAAGARNVVVVLDQVTDPHNVGAILRSAAAFGAKALVTTSRNAPEATGTLAKSASGALEIVPLVRVTNLARALDRLAELGYWRIGLDGAATQELAAVPPAPNTVLVLGAEGGGLRRLTQEKCDFLARLPILPVVESLNVSNAAACALYELARKAPPA
ncbi:MAG: 23S rRNA (guanosine(2251)-2'-O)-methyltransferase RlmB [Alphaproteobacteria bacterium]|nr:23S rRNA (guanosine(2251)-2'-O)-methyltransferase RlmB [Alphaproteobacteria bacterium]